MEKNKNNLISLKNNLLELSFATGVSGDEGRVIHVQRLLSKYTDKISKDSYHNIAGIIESKNPTAKTILLDAHLDEIGLMVTEIDDRGFLKFCKIGGVDERILPAMQVNVFGKRTLFGVVCTVPEYLCEKEDLEKVIDADKLVIDVGNSKEKVEALVAPGDFIGFRAKPLELKQGSIAGKSLDDRAGIVVILDILEQIYREQINVNVIALFSSQEERGQVGAIISAFRFKPDMAIVIDVTHGYTPDAPCHRTQVLGQGAAIGISPILSKRMTEKLRQIGIQKKIRCQFEVMDGNTGTNSNVIFKSNNGVETALISIPLKYMHTLNETLSIYDVKAVSYLISEYILSF